MPKTDAELRAQALGTRAEAVIFRRLLPSAAAASARSYFGGLPQLPDPAAWPRLRTGEHCSFIGQVDLESLPRFGERKHLPARGSLLFFADTSGEVDADSLLEGAVLFLPGGTAGRPETPPPPTLVRLYGYDNDYHFWWLGDAAEESALARVFPRWPVEGVPVDTYWPEYPASPLTGFERDYYDEARRYIGLASSLQAETFKSALGFASSRARKDLLDAALATRGRAWMPDGAWPYLWIDVRITVSALLRKIERAQGGAAVAAAGAEWLRQAPVERAFRPVPPAEGQAFRGWLGGLPAAIPAALDSYQLNGLIAGAVATGIGVVFGYAPDAASQLPPGARQIAAACAAPCSDWAGLRVLRHQLLGNPQSVQGAPGRMEDNHVLLMQFDSDDTTFWMWGDVGVLQFWIQPEDLLARRFDRVLVTLEGH